MKKVAIVYWSGSGNTERMADALNKDLKELGITATMFFASEFDDRVFADYDVVAFGCPACGNEELEEYEFQPMYESIRPMLSGKSIVLFGSYSWNDGEWMRIWEEQARQDGANLLHSPVICEEAPNEDCLNEIKEMAKSIAN